MSEQEEETFEVYEPYVRKARIRNVDMGQDMQETAIEVAMEALDTLD